MIGILPEEKKAADVVRAGIDRGILCLTAKDRVRLLPPLNIPFDTLREGIAVLQEVLSA